MGVHVVDGASLVLNQLIHEAHGQGAVFRGLLGHEQLVEVCERGLVHLGRQPVALLPLLHRRVRSLVLKQLTQNRLHSGEDLQGKKTEINFRNRKRKFV